jgi:hypothetical protein
LEGVDSQPTNLIAGSSREPQQQPTEKLYQKCPAMPKSRTSEILEAGAVYSSREFKSRLRIGEATWRKLKREGLRTYKIGKTVVVITNDFHDFLKSRNGQE